MLSEFHAKAKAIRHNKSMGDAAATQPTQRAARDTGRPSER
jgi:hypothetical protein